MQRALMKSVRSGALLPVAGLLAVGLLVLVAPAAAARRVARDVSAAEAEAEADEADLGLVQVASKVRAAARAKEGADDDGTYYDAANMPSWLVPPWVQPNSPTGPLIPTYGSGYTSKTFNVQKWKGAVPPQPVFPLDSGYAYSAIDNDHFPYVSHCYRHRHPLLRCVCAHCFVRCCRVRRCAVAQSKRCVPERRAVPQPRAVGDGTDFRRNRSAHHRRRGRSRRRRRH